jgi:hypothetical protein
MSFRREVPLPDSRQVGCRWSLTISDVAATKASSSHGRRAQRFTFPSRKGMANRAAGFRVPRRGVPRPRWSAFAVSHDLDGLPLSRSVRCVSTGHTPGVFFTTGILHDEMTPVTPEGALAVTPMVRSLPSEVRSAEAILRPPRPRRTGDATGSTPRGRLVQDSALGQTLSRLTWPAAQHVWHDRCSLWYANRHPPERPRPLGLTGF